MAISNPKSLNDSQLKDRLAIIEVIDAIATFADFRKWSQLKQLFMAEVTVDYTSLFPGEVQNISSQQLITQWQSILPGFDTTQHMITNHQIIMDGDKTTAIAYVRATHKLGNDIWVVGGYYIDKLVRTDEGWKIKAIQYNAMYEGNRVLIEQAATRVAEQTNLDK